MDTLLESNACRGLRILSYQWSNSETNKPFIAKTFPLKPGNRLPDLQIEAENGEMKLSDYRGKIIVLNDWATTCAPCIAEMPGLNKLVRKYKDKQVLFLAILDDKENWVKFMKFMAIEFSPHFIFPFVWFSRRAHSM